MTETPNRTNRCGNRADDRLVVILAGGRSERMGGRDKAEIRLCGMRLIDGVLKRLQSQSDRVVISASCNYGTGLQFLPDAPDAPPGPVGGVYTVHQWLESHDPGRTGFATVPVDGPFVPVDLVGRLKDGDGSAIASDGKSDHPTFAWWTLSGLSSVWPRVRAMRQFSLKALAEACDARRVVWPDKGAFVNINSPEDLEAASRENIP